MMKRLLAPPIGQVSPRMVRNDPPIGQVKAPKRSAKLPHAVS